MLELWDALFAEGLSLGLVDYVCVAMLMHIREVCEWNRVWGGGRERGRMRVGVEVGRGVG